MTASFVQVVQDDPYLQGYYALPSSASVCVGGSQYQGIAWSFPTTTTAGNTLAVYAVGSIDTGYTITGVGDNVNGAYTLVKHSADTGAGNQNLDYYHFPSAAAVSSQTASFTGTIVGSTQVLTVTGCTGTLHVGDIIQASGITSHSTDTVQILSFLTGTGGNGTYQLTSHATTNIGPVSMTAASAVYVTYSGQSDYVAMMMMEITGVGSVINSAATVNQTISGTTTDSITSGTQALGSSPAFIIGFCAEQSGTTAALVGTGFTSPNGTTGYFYYNTGVANLTMEYGTFSNPGTHAATFTPSVSGSTYDTMMIAYPVSGSGASGSAAITENADTSAGTGGVKVAGTSAITENADTSAGTGTVKVAGVSAITENADASAGTGGVAVAGTSAITEQADSSAGTGGIKVTGAAAITESSDASTGAGGVSVAGTSAITESADSVAASGAGSSAAAGSAAITEQSDTVAASGTVKVAGTSAITETSDTSTAAGAVSVAGTSAITETADANSAAGTATTGVSGSATITESTEASAGTGSVAVAGSAAITENADAVVAAGSVAVAGTSALTETQDANVAAGIAGTLGTGFAAIIESGEISMGAGSATPYVPAGNVWTADGMIGWSADGFLGWTADGGFLPISITTQPLTQFFEPQFFAALVVGTQITLSWLPVPGGVSGYHLYRDGVLIATLSQPTAFYIDTGVIGHQYNYALTSYTAGGSESPAALLNVQVYPGGELTFEVTFQEQPGEGGIPDLRWEWQ